MINLFFSYSHSDEEYRDMLEVHLAALKRQGVIDAWHDRRISAGKDLHADISGHLEAADIILLLVSPYFLASDYCYDIEMTRALERHESDEARVIPVIIHPCDWRHTPFRHLRATPTDGEPISKYPNIHDAHSIVIEDIRSAVQELLAINAAKSKEQSDVGIYEPQARVQGPGLLKGQSGEEEKTEQEGYSGRVPDTAVPLGLAPKTRSGDLFQNFRIERPGGNFNPVTRLWADAVTANSISASIGREKDASTDQETWFLRVKFNNADKSYPGNITIRPQEGRALAHDLKNPILKYKARLPKPTEDETGLLVEVAVGVRVINVWDQHWEYSDNPSEYVQLRVNSTEWSHHSVELMSRCWQLFRGDGHVHGGPDKPDFGVLCGVVFELGSPNVPGRPGAGAGTIDITQIRLEESS